MPRVTTTGPLTDKTAGHWLVSSSALGEACSLVKASAGHAALGQSRLVDVVEAV